LDMLKENTSVTVSMRHLSAPTPFCLSILTKFELKGVCFC
jgi:hypothetical protein